MLTAAEIAAMQATQSVALPDTCTIKRRTLTSDGAGGYTESWSDQATGVACRIAPIRSLSDAEAAVGGALQGKSVWQLTLPAGQDIQHTDRVVVGGATYEVVSLGSEGAWETATRAIVVRLD